MSTGLVLRLFARDGAAIRYGLSNAEPERWSR